MISKLLDQICELRVTIAYCELQIARKETAIAEIIESGLGEPAPVAAPAVVEVPRTCDGNLTCAEMLAQVLAENTAEVRTSKDLRILCEAKFPAAKEKFKVGIFIAIYRLKQLGKIKDDYFGYTKV